jgi:hypothetical protein
MLRSAAACGNGRMDNNADFLGRERFASLKCYVRARREPRELSPMDFVSPLVSRLSVVAAYVAFAFVAAIVLGVF